MYEKKHLKPSGLLRITSIKSILNQMNSVPGKLEGVELISIEEPSLEPVNVSDISPEWFTGFTDAEGCFFINIRLNVARGKYIVGAVFGLVQHSRDILLFQTLKEYLGYGRFVK